MPDVIPTNDQVEAFVNSIPWLGIMIALVGAVFLSVGAQLQHRGVAKVEERYGSGEKAGLSGGQLVRLLGRPSWVGGTLMLGLAIVFQLTALGFAPIIVVQPIGIVALVLTSIINARVSHVSLDRHAVRAIVMCVGGIGVFVTVAAFYATEHALSEAQLIIVLGILGVVLLALAAAFIFFRKKVNALFYIAAGGVLYGFVASIAKVIINRILTGNFDWVTVVGGVGLLLALGLGFYFVQTAYSVGAPDLVIAGLTVIDPLVAVAIGIFVLGEASETPPWALLVWAAAGAVAIFGVFQLAKHHPQTHRRDEPGELSTLR
ncbi:DMT family transporter [Protaetiibacter mangrovi]|uniref:DMT family transporter n=1 Tax=Protaetiibacter mangrovi TaxID=2970926 RepID=A0ABT1ZBK3_9MICO|nr:DMT family transporter [Protaetiibacter mangrovi]MCS0498079.1 DMT family transporter [Protaetiibacter mangrovi]